jgi:hypothetical protein
LEDLYAEAFEAADEAVALFGDDAISVVGDGLAIVADVAAEVDAESFEVGFVFELADFAGGGEEGFGGDTAAIDAGTSHFCGFYHGGFESASNSVEGSSVATDACSDNE